MSCILHEWRGRTKREKFWVLVFGCAMALGTSVFAIAWLVML